jgi:hypothetical protein
LALSQTYIANSTRNSKFQNFPKYFTEVHLSSKELAYTSLKYVAASRVWSFAGLKLVIPRNNIFGAVGNVCKEKKSKYVIFFFCQVCIYMIVVLARISINISIIRL